MGVRRFFSGVMQHLDWQAAVTLTGTMRFSALERAVEFLRIGRPDAIFWSPSHRGPLNAYHHVVSVHDCINVEYTFRDDWRLPAFRKLFNVVLNRAEAIVALSHATKSAILRNYTVAEHKVLVISPGFESPSPSARSALAQANDAPFVLLVTNAFAHKNTVQACRAFIRSKACATGVVLRVVGSLAAEALQVLSHTRAAVDMHAHVDDATLVTWYQRCLFLFSPSLAEGYNLPIAEALAMGANVLCSDIPVHREFYEGKAEFFDPNAVDGIVEALNCALDRHGSWHASQPTLSARSYRDMAAEYRSLFQRIANTS